VKISSEEKEKNKGSGIGVMRIHQDTPFKHLRLVLVVGFLFTLKIIQE
jgi:hypothetical protein